MTKDKNIVFDDYAAYYDLLYRDKDYKAEAVYIEKLIRKYKPDTKKILDLGCGTGRHDFIFAEKGFEVTGVELSEQMIEKAKGNLKLLDGKNYDLKFVQGNIQEINFEEKFDVVVALFHVMSYQTKNEEIKKTFASVKKHLKPGGIFIFDFWYGPAVLTQRPESRIKILESEEIKIYRYAEPVLLINENVVDVNYKVIIENKQSGMNSEINETHRMRYFFLPEIKLFISDFEFELIQHEEWMTSGELTDKSWSAITISVNN